MVQAVILLEYLFHGVVCAYHNVETSEVVVSKFASVEDES